MFFLNFLEKNKNNLYKNKAQNENINSEFYCSFNDRN